MRAASAFVLVVGLVLAGCADHDNRVRPAGPPRTGKWTGLIAKCPTLESGTAKALGVSGAGKPTANYTAYGRDLVADCTWGSTDGKGPAATMKLNIWHQPDAADAQWQVLTAGDRDEVSGVGDEAIVRLLPSNITVLARSANAVITVTLSQKVDADQLKALQPKAQELTAEMLKSLR